MATSTTLGGLDTLTPVTDETIGERVKRERTALKWRQKDLADAAGLKSAETISNIERNIPTAGDERPSIPAILAAMEAERARRASEAPKEPQEDITRQLMEFLARTEVDDLRVRRGRSRKTRYIAFVLRDPDATEEEIERDMQDFHRDERRQDRPND